MPKINYVIIAGPQSSGKTTAINYLQEKFPQVVYHPEINQYTLFSNMQIGSIATTIEAEKQIHEADLARINSINDDCKLHVAETDIFHLAYYLLIVGRQFYHRAWRDYVKALSKFKVSVVFINTIPEISFHRRKKNYLQRIKSEIEKRRMNLRTARIYRQQMLIKYQSRIESLYPLWLKIYREIDFAKQKLIVENNHNSLENFLQEVNAAFKKILP